MSGPYVSEDGDVWIERRPGQSWPRAQQEARWMLSEMECNGPMKFEGIEKDVRISDEHEFVHGDDDACADSQGVEFEDPKFEPCCRFTDAYHFTAEGF